MLNEPASSDDGVGDINSSALAAGGGVGLPARPVSDVGDVVTRGGGCFRSADSLIVDDCDGGAAATGWIGRLFAKFSKLSLFK